MPFQQGNQLAANARRWRNAIDKALEMKSKAEGQQKLVEIAGQLIDKAADGDMAALKELGDRIDGKPSQQLVHTGDSESPIAIEEVKRPELTKEEWLQKHGIE